MYLLWKKLSRYTVLALVLLFPYQQRRAIERWLRGREEFRKLQLADWTLVSWGKSGRTWLRVMLSRFYQLNYGVSQRQLLGFDNLYRKNVQVPRVFFTHGNYLKDYTKHVDSKVDFYDKKVVLLVRDPRDIAVSQFFQWKYRMRPRKKRLNDYPPHGADLSIFDFVMNPNAGLPKIIDFLNGWAEEIPRIKDVLVVRYEDMRAEPEQTLKKILDFTGTPGSESQVKEAVAFAAYENMKKLEQKKAFWLSGSRLVPRDHKNPHSYKVRRAKVGGYRDYFDDRQIAQIDELVRTTLLPVFDYAAEAAHAESNIQ